MRKVVLVFGRFVAFTGFGFRTLADPSLRPVRVSFPAIYLETAFSGNDLETFFFSDQETFFFCWTLDLEMIYFLAMT